VSAAGPWNEVHPVWRSIYSTAAHRHAEVTPRLLWALSALTLFCCHPDTQKCLLAADEGSSPRRNIRIPAAMKVVDLGLMMGSPAPEHKAPLPCIDPSLTPHALCPSLHGAGSTTHPHGSTPTPRPIRFSFFGKRRSKAAETKSPPSRVTPRGQLQRRRLEAHGKPPCSAVNSPEPRAIPCVVLHPTDTKPDRGWDGALAGLGSTPLG